MPRYFITLSYNGKNYVGWQIQPNGISIQQKLQEAISLILRSEVDIVGAGRTDAGVHACKMVAHFDWYDESFSNEDLVFKLNSLLPKDIAIKSIKKVKPDAHARFSAISRTYKYYVTTDKNPFLNELTNRVSFIPDIDKMNALCPLLIETEDFSSFSKLHTDVKTNICKIEFAGWEREGNMYVFKIKADRFLRNMVRAIVGTLLEAGRGRLDERGLRRIIDAKNRQVAGDSAPGNALFLEDVQYPEYIWV
ncbi:MAG: tRNA pseudouridine(38-40) synthase TruA [Fermentimonas sp.]|jgi:tRNA pseudouridine38-40 synthase|nr:tRNA pseudouridine(38-40) synthase TruA [Fermentimonas sp.]HBT84456.1 tRNA pseudouridine(38-40) synthase TruA [Porphyromonadaceae bacterium]MDD2930339.1 tRNA pseudouridine(38-40) synthase TruA [Fermentimonas sp.]MDD3187995.1 tRNA pseudouridine(38-40) synthase TruA [Fermentimonas sp.]MDD3511083.1 tRNA pseudouridine(38-40) synthase TruA [Fermentimonas sp.]